MTSDILFCQIYDKNLKEMILKKNEAKYIEDKLLILIKFAENFTMLPEQWAELLSLSKRCKTIHLSPTINLCLYSTIYGDKNAKHTEWRNQNNIIAQLKNYTSKNRFELAEEALSFPHRYIEAIYGKYLFYSVAPITDDVKYKYDTNKRIYENINEIRHDINKWIKCIKGIQDKEVIIQNIELKLGKYSNYKNKNLWKFYFKFLKKNNLKEILEAYRKYTRLFISDKEAIEKYRQEIIKFTHLKESTTKYWIDTIKYEMTFGNLEHAYGILECGMEAIVGTQYDFMVKDKKHLNGIILICRILMMQAETNPTPAPAPATISNHQIEVKHILSQTPTVYFETANRQSLPFRQSYIRYILKNANAIVLKKLYSICKIFYWYTQAPLCYRLEISGDKKSCYCQESLYINEKDFNFTGLKNMHVYFKIAVTKCLNRNVLSKTLSKLQQCNINYMLIKRQDITITELEFMLSKDILEILLFDVNIADNHGQQMDVKSVIEIIQICPSFIGIEFINQDHFIVVSTSPSERVSQWRAFCTEFKFKNIFIQNQTCSILDLQTFIDYQSIKSINLQNTIVKDENNFKISKLQLEEFIKSEVNPMNNVFIQIIE